MFILTSVAAFNTCILAHHIKLRPSFRLPQLTLKSHHTAQFPFYHCVGFGGETKDLKTHILRSTQIKTGFNPQTKVLSYDHNIHAKGDGHGVKCVVFEPKGSESASLPVLVYFHGGGFVVGNAGDGGVDAVCSRLAVGLDCVVVAVDYPKAPERMFPIAVIDSYEVMSAIAEYRMSLPNRADRTKIMIAGDSAGGNLALVMSYLCGKELDGELRPRSFPSTISHQILFNPWADVLNTNQVDYDGLFITNQVMTFFVKAYLGNDAKKIVQVCTTDVRVDPTLDTKFKFPSTTIVVGKCDALGSQSHALKVKIEAAGGHCNLYEHACMPHGYVLISPHHAQLSFDFIFEDVKRAAGTDKDYGDQGIKINTRFGKGVIVCHRPITGDVKIDFGWGMGFLQRSEILSRRESVAVVSMDTQSGEQSAKE